MRYIFYLLPCLLNIVSGLLFFITAKRAADADVPSLAVTATLSIWAVIYAASSFIIGKYDILVIIYTEFEQKVVKLM